MPKKVDAAARRRDVVDALFRVAERDGLARVSLRTVADEAGLNLGSLRHYFASQQELMRFAMQAMIDQVSDRLQAHVDRIGSLGELTRRGRVAPATELLAELLPLDDERRAEFAVFLDFTAHARTHPELRDLAVRSATGSRTLIRRVVTRLLADSACTEEIELATEQLASLVDGLGVNATLYPEVLTASRAREVLHAHLASLAC
ncbi:HTH-type transcriptional regulator PksA [Actinocatenispora thailandica]|uniref:HTH-type transcriptional regulator PksA n=1 Tax=Actinocatenispora thailandica TaxID=227318 RepID=A0A7R7DVW5_9ACTN|nr:TetR family transcriptional regulator C-terminal domain-containing protein [Actinocatenispora thailandica]BCJ38327.1 HTH-type transcriptional regulator PksA [Actinocatenispora thailandica]